MSTLQMPTHDHAQFDTICEPLGEFEHLPAVKVERPDVAPEPRLEAGDDPLDGLILAGLVAPY
jgi:hypothetical protein